MVSPRVCTVVSSAATFISTSSPPSPISFPRTSTLGTGKMAQGSASFAPIIFWMALEVRPVIAMASSDCFCSSCSFTISISIECAFSLRSSASFACWSCRFHRSLFSSRRRSSFFFRSSSRALRRCSMFSLRGFLSPLGGTLSSSGSSSSSSTSFPPASACRSSRSSWFLISTWRFCASSVALRLFSKSAAMTYRFSARASSSSLFCARSSASKVGWSPMLFLCSYCE
mmetsp:Transcript_11493/g.27840  ORF Transcript_11493/g.27840 Transcript_11493/m.27840 type:complete len:228 (-) Transcript_11493:183-866(-)